MAESSFSSPLTGFFPLFVSLLVLLLFDSSTLISFVKAKEVMHGHHQSRTSSFGFQETRIEKLIRQLNLFPKLDVNISPRYRNLSEPGLVEKSFHLDALGDSGATVEELGHHAGYFKLEHTHDSRMFYFFFESRSKKSDPVVIWFTGGPGCSGELALFYENGPFHIANNLSLVWNDFGWDKVSNIIFVDQPVGTGFSYSSDMRDLRHNEEGISNDMYDFLQAFFKAHPEHAQNDFYITGESYAGHYIPAVASRIHKGNKDREGVHINLKGFAIGNGLTNPEIQYQAYPHYALDKKLIQSSDAEDMAPLVSNCVQTIKRCGSNDEDACQSGFRICNAIFEQILAIAGDINYYDIRKKCDEAMCYDFSNLGAFLNDKKVKEAIGVGNIDFVSCSMTVYRAMINDWMKNLEAGIPALLEDGIRVLIYAGEYDLICNWLGNWNWVHAMKWSGQKDFVAAPEVPFVVDGKEAGLQKSHGGLSFLKVHDAGHMVPMDQPRASLEMLQKWMLAKLPLANKISPRNQQNHNLKS